MRILQYHPSVSAYVACNRNGGDTYYDLSEDIVSCTVNRLQEAPSKFTLHLSNPNGKYANVFMPMDRVKIYAGKDGEMFPLITGYLTSAPQFQLVRNELTLSGADSLYRLQRLYFDPGLIASQVAMGYGGSHPGWDYGDLAFSILRNIAAWPEDQIDISADIPDRIIEFAKGVYRKQMGDMKWVGTLQDEILNALQTTGPVLTSGSSGWAGGDPDAGLQAGMSLDIPEPYGTVMSNEVLDWWQGFYHWPKPAGIVDPDRTIWKIWLSKGHPYNNHLAIMDGRYLVATTNTFGSIGDRVTFTLSTGIKIPCILFDTKDQSDAGCNMWGHNNGACVLEFMVEKDWFVAHHYGGPGHDWWVPEWAGRVVSASNFGSILS